MGRRRKKDNKALLQVIIGALVLLVIVLAGNNFDSSLLDSLADNVEIEALEDVSDTQSTTQSTTSVSVDGNLIIDFIDVGQGDSILIRQGEHAMLIDGGTSECKDDLLSFLESEDIESFDYIIGTHPHEDHIGSLDDVVNEYDFDVFLFPEVTTTTKTFENLVTAVASKGKTFTAPVSGQEYTLGEATFVILAPNSDEYQSLNNYSIVVKMTYGNNTFLFTGDAESISEAEILELYDDLHADVLKVGHHGSTTSTSQSFLNAVSPSYAVISVGEDNSYNHPTQTTMTKLSNLNIPVYRTDEQGTIECVSDGINITFNVEPGTYSYRSN